MPTYFKPLRRKFGAVTLMMACVLMGGWVRSLMIADEVVAASFGRILNCCSARGMIVWHVRHEEEEDVLSEIYFEHSTLRYDLPSDDYLVDWWVGTLVLGPVENLKRLPYWSVVCPLTLISLGLLRSKPRKTTPRKIAEPVSAERE